MLASWSHEGVVFLDLLPSSHSITSSPFLYLGSTDAPCSHLGDPVPPSPPFTGSAHTTLPGSGTDRLSHVYQHSTSDGGGRQSNVHQASTVQSVEHQFCTNLKKSYISTLCFEMRYRNYFRLLLLIMSGFFENSFCVKNWKMAFPGGELFLHWNRSHRKSRILCWFQKCILL